MARNLDLKIFSEAALALYEPGLNGNSYVERSFNFISRLVKADFAGYGVVDGASRQLSANFDHTPPGLVPCLRAYGQLMHKYAPFRFDPAVNEGKPYSVGDFFSRPKFRDLDIYQEVHAPMGFDDHCMVNVPAEPGLSIFIGLFRSGGSFGARDKEILGLAQPHLSNARRLALAQTAAAEVPIEPGLFARCGFTPRESEVLYWLTQGKSNVEIAQLLHVRTDTVSDYLHAIYEKLGVENRVAATVAALSVARVEMLRAKETPRAAGPFRVQVVQAAGA